MRDEPIYGDAKMELASGRRPAASSGFIAIFAAILPVTITGTPITVQPGMVQGMVDYLNFADVQAGFVASAEVGGLMLATVIFAFVSSRLNWKLAYAIGLGVVIAGNLLSLIAGVGPLFTIIRTITGMGAGLVTAIGFAAIGETEQAPRNYGWAVAMIIGYSAVALWLLPELFSLGGYDALIIAYAVVTAVCLPLVPWLPNRKEVSGDAEHMSVTDIKLLSMPGFLAVLSVLLFFIGYAAAWTYMALIGRDAGIDESAVSHILSISQFAGVAGALSIVIQSGKVHDLLQAAVILLVGAVSIFAFAIDQSYALFLGLNCLFQFCWNAGQPLLLGIIASRDTGGRLLRFAIPMQYIGLAIGPAFAASQLGPNSNYPAVMIGSGIFAAVTALTIIPIIFASQRNSMNF